MARLVVFCLGFTVLSQCFLFIQCTDKIFITDVVDGKIFVGENSGFDFHGEDIREIPLSGVDTPTGIDYDYRTDKIYWSDQDARTINRASLDGSNQEILIDQSKGIGYPQGIVLDLMTNRMFWTDTLLELIMSASLLGSNRRSIISTGLFLPWGLTLSQKRGKLYWTDEGISTGKIEMSNKDGSDRRQLITARFRQPRGLALDSQEQRLYWTENHFDVIQSIDLDDLSDRRDHAYAKKSGHLEFIGISLYFTSIYFTDFTFRVIYVSDLNGVEEVRNITGLAVEAPTHVKIYADLTCIDPCPGNSRCQLVAYNTSECTCIVGWTGLNCLTRITCTLPNPPAMASFVNLSDSYTASTTLTVMCDNGNDQAEWICNGYTGKWEAEPIDCSTQSSADKIFITDVVDGKIFVGENSGFDFHGEDIREIPLRGVDAPTGIDYDYRTDKIYWSDESARTINRASLDGSEQEILIDRSQGVGYPQGIVLDLMTNRMFWTDTLLELIVSASLLGSNRRSIISTGLYLPWGLTLSQKRGKLYWTDQGLSTGKIEMSNKDGTDRRQLITTRLKEPNSLALDSQEQRLYWTESYYDVIESIDLDDLSDRREHVNAERGDIVVFGISLYFTSIYFTDFESRGLHEADIGAEEIVNVIGFTAGAPTHVKIYADLTCIDPCPGNSRCQLVAYNTSECTCIVGWTGLNCLTRITCILPNPPPMASFVNPSANYTASTTLSVTCDNGNDQVEWICNGYTGSWEVEPIDCSTRFSADKIFITDVDDGKIFVGENSGFDFHGQDIREIPLRGIRAPTGIDYDYRTDTIYWSDEDARTINRASLDGSNQEILIEGIGYPQGIVLDLMTNRMFWTDTLLEQIVSASVIGSNRRTIISTGLFRPWGLTLSQKRGKLYWTDEGLFTGKIEMSNKDGSDRRQLITTQLIEPNSLALDSKEQRLYWTESYYDVIESIDLDNLTDRREHVYAASGDLVVFGISLYFTSIYFTDFASRGLHEADLGVEEVRDITGFTVGAPTHVKIYTDLTCTESCPGNRRCQFVAYNTPGCTCIVGWTGLNCLSRITCTLPNPPLMASFVNPSASYTAGSTVSVTCDNSNDQVEWICNGYTGNWEVEPIACPTQSSVDCTENSQCMNGGTCETTGTCTCAPGFTGGTCVELDAADPPMKVSDSPIGIYAGLGVGVVVFLLLVCCCVSCAKRKPQRSSVAAPPLTAVYTAGAQPGVVTVPRATSYVNHTVPYYPLQSGAMPGKVVEVPNTVFTATAKPGVFTIS